MIVFPVFSPFFPTSWLAVLGDAFLVDGGCLRVGGLIIRRLDVEKKRAVYQFREVMHIIVVRSRMMRLFLWILVLHRQLSSHSSQF
jgi:hypothetical protein